MLSMTSVRTSGIECTCESKRVKSEVGVNEVASVELPAASVLDVAGFATCGVCTELMLGLMGLFSTRIVILPKRRRAKHLARASYFLIEANSRKLSSFF
jgi:hypothetical protein